MNQTYRDTVRTLEQLQVDPEYLLGWQSGFLGHPQREEQRLNDAWEAGYNDGREHHTDNHAAWLPASGGG